jgi:hypothetical protein
VAWIGVGHVRMRDGAPGADNPPVFTPYIIQHIFYVYAEHLVLYKLA